MELEIRNGFTGMNRDVALKLVSLFRSEEMKIRAVIGMCQEHLLWKSHSAFTQNRLNSVIPLKIVERESSSELKFPQLSKKCLMFGEPPNPMYFCELIYHSNGVLINHVILDRIVTKGVFRCAGSFFCDPEQRESFAGLGVIDSRRVAGFKYPRRPYPSRETAILYFSSLPGREPKRRLPRMTAGTLSWQMPPDYPSSTPDGTRVTVEVDMKARRIYFLMNNKMLPKCVIMRPTAFNFMFLGRGCMRFENICVQRMTRSTLSTIPRKEKERAEMVEMGWHMEKRKYNYIYD